MKNDGAIIWPADPRAASDHFLRFVLQVVDTLGIAFTDRHENPVAIARAYLAGACSEAEYLAQRETWLDDIWTRTGLRDFRSEHALMSRLAAIVLGATPKFASRLGEQVSWFVEVLCALGVDGRRVDLMMHDHFQWPPWSSFSFNDDPDVMLDLHVAAIPAGITTKDSLMDALERALKLPSYFGRNWDALLDCLRDFHWVRVRTISIRHADVPALPAADLRTYLEVLHESVEAWKPGEAHVLEVVFPVRTRDDVRRVFEGA